MKVKIVSYGNQIESCPCNKKIVEKSKLIEIQIIFKMFDSACCDKSDQEDGQLSGNCLFHVE